MMDNIKYMLITLIFVLIIALLMLVALKGAPNDLERPQLEYLAYHEGRLDAYDSAWEQGRSHGKLESEYLAEYYGLITQAESYSDGWEQGYKDGQYREHWGYR